MVGLDVAGCAAGWVWGCCLELDCEFCDAEGVGEEEAGGEGEALRGVFLASFREELVAT